MNPKPETPSAILREAAIYKHRPREPWRVGSWVDDDAFAAVYARLDTAEEFRKREVPITARRMFLLLVSLEREEIESANAAAYHGDIDGDFDY